MALRRTLTSRFVQSAKSSSHTTPIRPDLPKTPPPHRRISQSAAAFDRPHLPLPIRHDLMKRIRSSFPRDRIPPPPRSESETEQQDGGISVQDASKLLKISRIETATPKLKAIPKIFISYSDFAQICGEIAGDSDEFVVFLRPEQLAQAIESLIDQPQPISDQRSNELKEMEAEKAVIDGKAAVQVRRELWAGLGLVVLQTAAFMRLTFWELSSDVMEPVCFFTTSIYFIMGWAFFLRTSKEPSFEGFFAGRFAAKQRRLMKAHCFDLSRFNELNGLRQRKAHIEAQLSSMKNIMLFCK